MKPEHWIIIIMMLAALFTGYQPYRMHWDEIRAQRERLEAYCATPAGEQSSMCYHVLTAQEGKEP